MRKELMLCIGTLFYLFVWLSVMTINNCYAMFMQQPKKIGEISLLPMGWFELKGFITQEGDYFKNEKYLQYYPNLKNKKNKIYNKGVACFGCGRERIYFHYDSRDGMTSYNPDNGYGMMSKLGDKNLINCVDIDVWLPTVINCIETDNDITLFLLSNYDASGLTGVSYVLIGRISDGSYVKYFDTIEVLKRYYKNKRELKIKDIKINNDKIVVKYDRINGNKVSVEGELLFKWDDKTKWFSVANII